MAHLETMVTRSSSRKRGLGLWTLSLRGTASLVLLLQARFAMQFDLCFKKQGRRREEGKQSLARLQWWNGSPPPFRHVSRSLSLLLRFTGSSRHSFSTMHSKILSFERLRSFPCHSLLELGNRSVRAELLRVCFGLASCGVLLKGELGQLHRSPTLASDIGNSTRSTAFARPSRLEDSHPFGSTVAGATGRREKGREEALNKA